MTQVFNAEVDVNAYYFAGKDMRSMPRRISYGNEAVTFADGLRVRLERGGVVSYIYNMLAEGGRTYCLRQSGSQWTLVGAR